MQGVRQYATNTTRVYPKNIRPPPGIVPKVVHQKNPFEIVYGIHVPSSFKISYKAFKRLENDTGETIQEALAKLLHANAPSSSFVYVDLKCNPNNIRWLYLTLDILFASVGSRQLSRER